ncbi:hypothetical protein LJC22_02345 [Desulfosarcina sp. OttesenSCG-928-G10]|nr:hypothetical protein [Desulfosarcina sp. OttesenSCG-928-G10]
MKLKAEVRTITGDVRHYIGLSSFDVETQHEIDTLPVPKSVEITGDSHGFFLLRFNTDGDFVGDTWHETLEDAKEQAAFEFEIKVEDWKEE